MVSSEERDEIRRINSTVKKRKKKEDIYDVEIVINQ